MGRASLAWCTVILLAVASMLFVVQGWKGRIVILDLLPQTNAAQAFLDSGRIPDRGCLSSYYSFIPPGSAWLMVPGVAIVSEPRLLDFVATSILHIATAIGLFLLARSLMGTGCGVLSVALYCFSDIGLSFASSLWPRGQPSFYVWMVYLLVCWVRRADPRFLAAALLVWAAGMYVFLEIAPAILIIPAFYLLFRPRWLHWSLLAALVLGFIIWFPYLRFEASRDFADIRSQVLRRSLANHAVDYRKTCCDPSIELIEPSGGMAANAAGGIRQTGAPGPLPAFVWKITGDRSLGFFYNFDRTAQIPGVPMLLALVVLSTLFLFTITSIPASKWEWLSPRFLGWSSFGMIVAALASNELFLAGLSPDGALEDSTIRTIRLFEIVLLCCAAFLLATRGRLAVWARTAAERLTLRAGFSDRDRSLVLLALSLLAPWLLLMTVAEPSPAAAAKRFLWLWPVQLLVMAAFVRRILPSLIRRRPAVMLVAALLIGPVVANPFVVSKIRSWRTDGFAGKDAPEVRAVDFLAEKIRAKGAHAAAIGYSIFVSGFEARYHALDSIYKVGAEFDFLLKQRHGIVNTNGCPEGLSAIDEYRIVQKNPKGIFNRKFAVPPAPWLQIATENESYLVLSSQREFSAAPAQNQRTKVR